MRRTLAIAKRISKQLLRDKRTLALIFIAPILIMFLLNIMFSANTTTDVSIATYNVAQQVEKQLNNTKHISIYNYSSQSRAQTALKEHRVDATIIGNSNNHYNITYANTDSTKTTLTKQALQAALTKAKIQQMQTTITSVARTTGIQVPENSQIKINNHYQYGNSDTGFFAKIIPILLGFFVFFFVFLISGMALLGERTSGTLDRLLATPVKRSEIVFGYMISYGILAILQTIVIVLVTIWLLKIEVVGSIVNIVIINTLLAFVALAFGILMSTFANSEFQMMQFLPLVIVPQVFFSGIIPLDQMASWVHWIGKILPITYAGDALSGIILRGSSLNDISGDIIALLIFLVILTIANILGLKRYRTV